MTVSEVLKKIHDFNNKPGIAEEHDPDCIFVEAHNVLYAYTHPGDSK